MATPKQRRSANDVDRAHDPSAFVWNEHAFRLLFEASPDAIFLIDDDRFLDCNQAAVEMLRYARKDDLLSHSPSELSPDLQPDGQASRAKATDMIAIAIEK